MNSLVANCLRLLFIVVFGAAAAHAQPLKVFVSSTGNDANAGTRAKPKRTFQAAHDAVAGGGEIIALKIASYGPLKITKSVTVTGPETDGALVGVLNGKNGIVIDAGQGGEVTLRGLHIIAQAGKFGIYAQTLGALRMFDCTVSGFTVGLFVGSAGGGIPTMALRHCTFRDCASAGLSFFLSATLYGSIDDCQFVHNGETGADFGSSTRITVRDSLFSGNGANGVATGQDSKLTLQNCVITNNKGGLLANDTVIVNGCTIMNNTGQGVAGNAVYSFRNNNLADNNPDGSFTGDYTGE